MDEVDVEDGQKCDVQQGGDVIMSIKRHEPLYASPLPGTSSANGLLEGS